MLKEDREIEQGAYGWRRNRPFCRSGARCEHRGWRVLRRWVRLIALAVFVVFSLICVMRAFMKVGK